LETLSFSEAIAAESSRRDLGWGDMWRYAESSLYAEKLDEFITTFGKDNVKVIYFDDFTKNTSSILTDLLSYISVDPKYEITTEEKFNRTGTPKSILIADILRSQNFFKHFIKLILPVEFRRKLRTWLMDINTGNKPELSPTLRTSLLHYFRDDITKLEHLVGKSTNWL
jgi:hypothetical protein